MGSWFIRVFLVAVLVALALVMVPRWWHGGSQQEQLSAIRSGLKAQGLEQVSVAIEKKKIRLSGEVPVREFRDEAIDIAHRHVEDSKLVKDIVVARPISPYKLTARMADKVLGVQGYVNTRRQKERLIRWLNSQLDVSSKTIHLRYAEGAPLHWVGTVRTVVTALLKLREGEAQLGYHRIRLTGEADSEVALDAVRQALLPLQGMEYVIDLSQVTVALTCIEKIHALAVRSPLRFAQGRDQIAPESENFLEALAVTARTCPDVSFIVNGYTDNRGDPTKNLQLSQARAEAVVHEMEKRGIRPGRFTAQGHGSASPVADNRTASGRSRNRRIEFSVKNPS